MVVGQKCFGSGSPKSWLGSRRRGEELTGRNDVVAVGARLSRKRRNRSWWCYDHGLDRLAFWLAVPGSPSLW